MLLASVRWLALLTLVPVGCASAPAQPIAKDAATTATLAPLPIAPAAMPAPPPPPKKVLGASERIPLAEVVKALTPNRHVVVLGPRKESVLADLEKEGFAGFRETFPPKRHGVYPNVASSDDDIIVVDIDDDDVPMIASDGWRALVVVRWRHRTGKRLSVERGYVDTRCHEAVCDAFTVYRTRSESPKADFGDLPLAEMMPWDGKPRARQ